MRFAQMHVLWLNRSARDVSTGSVSVVRSREVFLTRNFIRRHIGKNRFDLIYFPKLLQRPSKALINISRALERHNLFSKWFSKFIHLGLCLSLSFYGQWSWRKSLHKVSLESHREYGSFHKSNPLQVWKCLWCLLAESLEDYPRYMELQ